MTTWLRRTWSESPSTIFALVFLVGVLLLLTIYPLTPYYDPWSSDLRAVNLGIGSTAPNGAFHILGSDQLGRDTFSQLILGGRYSLFIAVASVGLSVVIGPLLGVMAAYFGGPLDRLVVGLADLQLAIPRVLLVIAVVAILGSSVPLLILLLGATGWVVYGRVVRSIALSVKSEDYVAAAVGMGAGSWRVVLSHVLPNTLRQVVVLASLDVGKLVIIESSLSYLGLGVQEPASSWGLMISRAESLMQSQPRLLILPALALTVVVLAMNFAARALTSETRDQVRATRVVSASSEGV